MSEILIIFLIVILTGIFSLCNIIDRYKKKRWASNFHKYSDYFLFVIWLVLVVVSIVLLINHI